MISMASIQTDFYKLFHKFAYHKDIKSVYSNFTSRSNRLCNIKDNDKVAFVGLQYFILDYLIEEWNTTFFNLTKEEAVSNFKRYADNCLGLNYDASHVEDLHDLGYLPIEIKALPEGSLVNYQVPPMTFKNTVDDYEWLTNYIETPMSTENWPIQTSCTTSIAYYRNIKAAFEATGGPMELLPFMGHDFSFRGMFGRHAAAMSTFGHIASGFVGSDTIPGAPFAEKYYGADVAKELVLASVQADEHSTVTSAIAIICAKTGCSKLEAEVEYVETLFKTVPIGILSHVADSYNLFDFIIKGLPLLHAAIMARDGTFVIRPDTGNPVDIICGTGGTLLDNGMYRVFHGDPAVLDTTWTDVTEAESKGVVELLWDEFGGTTTEQGYKLLDSHIGAIYGDAITLDRQQQIITKLMAKGFVPSVVLGIGSYSFQYVTRDTHGSAIKATSVETHEGQYDVFKDPATDRSKKSAKGLLRVEYENGNYVLYDEQTPEQEKQGLLKTVFKDGVLTRTTTLSEIRNRIAKEL